MASLSLRSLPIPGPGLPKMEGLARYARCEGVALDAGACSPEAWCMHAAVGLTALPPMHPRRRCCGSSWWLTLGMSWSLPSMCHWSGAMSGQTPKSTLQRSTASRSPPLRSAWLLQAAVCAWLPDAALKFCTLALVSPMASSYDVITRHCLCCKSLPGSNGADNSKHTNQPAPEPMCHASSRLVVPNRSLTL